MSFPWFPKWVCFRQNLDLSRLVTTLQKDFKSIGAQFRRDDTARKKIFEASEKKIQATLRRLTEVGENKQLESTFRSLIREECASLFNPVRND